VAVNETGHTIDLLSADGKLLNQLKPKKSMHVDLKYLTKEEVKIKIKGFLISPAINLIISEQKTNIELKNNKDEKADRPEEQLDETEAKKIKKFLPNHVESEPAVELGTTIKMCDSPYIKTKVIRFSNRFTLVNKMNIPLVIRCIYSDWQLRIGPKS
jgi:hypothetical protein